jgi:hypothetical protein
MHSKARRLVECPLRSAKEMTEAQTYSWIFYATSLIAQKEPVKIREIESVADGINHAIPTQKEISNSIRWLQSKDLVSKEGKKLILTQAGSDLISKLTEKHSTTMKAWDSITSELHRMGVDNTTNLNCNTMEADPVGGDQ